MPMPRRSIATMGWSLRTSPPAWASQTGSWVDDGRSEPVVNTSGPASCGVWPDRARTTPMVTEPEPPLVGSRSESKVAQSSLTPGAAGTPASAVTFDVQSRHDRSFLGAAIGGGPLTGLVVVGAPCGLAPEFVAKRGSAPNPGTQPASSALTATRTVAEVTCRLMPTTVAVRP